MEETIKETPREKFQKILTETIFKGDHTESIIARIGELYDPKKGSVFQSDLVLYSLIDFSQQDAFIEKIKSGISDFNSVKNNIEGIVTNKSASTEFISDEKKRVNYYDHLNYFLNNITNGLADAVTKIECDSINFGYPEGVLDNLKENIIKLNSELKPLKSSLSTQMFNLNKRLIKLNEETHFAGIEYVEELEKINDDIMEQSNKESVELIKSMMEKINIAVIDIPSIFSDESNINFLTNSMMDCKYDKSMGSSLTPLNDTDGYVQCGIFPTAKKMA